MRRHRLARAAGELERAVALLLQMLQLHERQPDVWLRLGEVRTQRQRAAEAVEAFERLVEVEPDESAGWLLLARARGRAGREAEAARALQRGVELAGR